MESVLLPVLEQLIAQALGSTNFTEILTTQLPQVVAIIMQFVENQVIPLYHTVASDIQSYIKHTTALNFLDALFLKFIGSPVGKEIKTLISQFIPVIVSASKGKLAINQGTTPAPPPAPATVPATVYVSPDPPALATTAETTSSAPPIPAKKGFLRRNASVKQ